jgi:RNA polymerase sigma factor (sigma-70 family)
MVKKIPKIDTIHYFNLLIEGSEKGLDFFYNQYAPFLLWKAHKNTQDLSIAENIVQEVFFKLWLFRKNVQTVEDVLKFLKTQMKQAVTLYFSTTRNRFNRSLLRLDGIENFQEFMLGQEDDHHLDLEDEDWVYEDQLEHQKQEQWEKLTQLLPNLSQEQQQFIQLSLKFSFNYERIAYYLGGISEYQVALQLEKTIEKLKAIFQSENKLDLLQNSNKITLEGDFTEHQSEVFRLRYDLQMSFEEISEAMQLSSQQVRTIFIEAHTHLKKPKKQHYG